MKNQQSEFCGCLHCQAARDNKSEEFKKALRNMANQLNDATAYHLVLSQTPNALERHHRLIQEMRDYASQNNLSSVVEWLDGQKNFERVMVDAHEQLCDFKEAKEKKHAEDILSGNSPLVNEKD